jgi:hypothetical protein
MTHVNIACITEFFASLVTSCTSLLPPSHHTSIADLLGPVRNNNNIGLCCEPARDKFRSRGNLVVKALGYKLEGHGFETQ